MILFAALSTPRPLSREREHAGKRARLGLAGAAPAHAANVDGNSIELTLARAIQTNEGHSVTRLANITHIQVLRIEIRSLAKAALLCGGGGGGGGKLSDLMRDNVGSYKRYHSEDTLTALQQVAAGHNQTNGEAR